MHLYNYGLRDIYFIPWVLIQCYFVGWISPFLAMGNSFGWLLFQFNIVPWLWGSIVVFLCISLFLCATRWSIYICVLTTDVLESAISSRCLSFFIIEFYWKPRFGVLIATYMSLFLGSFSWQSTEKYVCIYMIYYIYVYNRSHI